jgi:hypothetical protein
MVTPRDSVAQDSDGAERATPTAGPAGDDGEPTVEGAFSPDGVDLTLIQWMLDLTPEERLQAAQSMIDLVGAARPRDAD